MRSHEQLQLPRLKQFLTSLAPLDGRFWWRRKTSLPENQSLKQTKIRLLLQLQMVLVPAAAAVAAAVPVQVVRPPQLVPPLQVVLGIPVGLIVRAR